MASAPPLRPAAGCRREACRCKGSQNTQWHSSEVPGLPAARVFKSEEGDVTSRQRESLTWKSHQIFPQLKILHWDKPSTLDGIYLYMVRSEMYLYNIVL